MSWVHHTRYRKRVQAGWDTSTIVFILVYAVGMKEEQTRGRAICDISSLRMRAMRVDPLERSACIEIIDKAFSLWMHAGGDPKEEEFYHVMGRLALHAMAHRQLDLADAIIEAGYPPCRDTWVLAGIRGHRIVGGLAHCLAGMDADGRLNTLLPDRVAILETAIARPEHWAGVLDIAGLHHGFDALVATETAHWSDLRKRRGPDNQALHDERARFERALIDAGCPVAREDTHHSLLAAAMPEFAAPPCDLQAGLAHVHRVIEWGGGGTLMARAGAWTAAIRRDVRQALDDPKQAGPRVALLELMNVALEAPKRSHVHAGVALAALQKGYMPVVERLIAKGEGFDWLDESDMAGILAKLGGGRAEMAQAVARVPMGWLGPHPESRVNAINVQVANCNVDLLDRAIAEGWPVADAMGQRKTPLKTIAGREPSHSQTPEAMRATMRCLVQACMHHGVDVAVDNSLLKLAVGLRDKQSMGVLWAWAETKGYTPDIQPLIEACGKAQLGLHPVEMQQDLAVELFEFIWERKHSPVDHCVLSKTLLDCITSRNRQLFDRLEGMVDCVEGSAWPPLPHPDDMARIEDLGHMVEVMAAKGANDQLPDAWLSRMPVVNAVMAARSRMSLSAQTPDPEEPARSMGRL